MSLYKSMMSTFVPPAQQNALGCGGSQTFLQRDLYMKTSIKPEGVRVSFDESGNEEITRNNSHNIRMVYTGMLKAAFFSDFSDSQRLHLLQGLGRLNSLKTL